MVEPHPFEGRKLTQTRASAGAHRPLPWPPCPRPACQKGTGGGARDDAAHCPHFTAEPCAPHRIAFVSRVRQLSFGTPLPTVSPLAEGMSLSNFKSQSFTFLQSTNPLGHYSSTQSCWKSMGLAVSRKILHNCLRLWRWVDHFVHPWPTISPGGGGLVWAKSATKPGLLGAVS